MSDALEATTRDDWLRRAAAAGRVAVGATCCGKVMDGGTIANVDQCRVCGGVLTMEEMEAAHGLQGVIRHLTWVSELDASRIVG